MLRSLLVAFVCVIPFLTSVGHAEDQDDSLQFTDFFRTITSGGHKYRGIELEAPKTFRTQFTSRYNVASWVGDQSRLESELTKKSVDLWGDWYATPSPSRLLLPSTQARLCFTAVFNSSSLVRDLHGRTLDELWSLEWSNWSAEERSLFAKIYVFDAPIFARKTLFDFVAENYKVDTALVRSRLDVKMLAHEKFVDEVRQMGWKGEIYFRGITGPEPSDSQRLEILLDADYLHDRTEETIPLFQMAEFIGILTHELNHVFQTLDAQKQGINLEIHSIEGALLIEGGAEFLAEKAMQDAAVAGDIPALNLYAKEQAIGLMNKDAEKNYQFLPYKVGLPLVDSLFASGKDSSVLLKEMYQTIESGTSLSELVGPQKSEPIFRLYRTAGSYPPSVKELVGSLK